jgi:hypothetical protein
VIELVVTELELDPDLQPDPRSLQVGFGESHQRGAEFDEAVDDLPIQTPLVMTME